MTTPVGPPAPGPVPGDPRTRLLSAARALEAVFYQQVWRAMREAAPAEGGLFPPSPGERAFRDLLDETVAQLAAERSTRGVGMALYRQLSRHLPPEEAAGAESLRTMEPHRGAGR